MYKDCQAHEKRWRDYCVDKNLDERWLEELNDLATLNLISICEGHCIPHKQSSSKFPHINLKLKDKLLPGFVKDWDTMRPKVLNKVHQFFQKGDTFFNLELRFKLRAGRGRLVYQEELTLKLRCFKARDSENMDTESYLWFEQSVESIKSLDNIFSGWYETKMN